MHTFYTLSASHCAALGGRRPLNLNQWQQRAHRPPAASATACHSGSLSNGTPTDCHSTSDFCFEPSGGLLDLLPEQYDNYDFANLDTDAIYQSLDWNLDTSVGALDGAVLPDMNAAGVGQDLGIGEDFLSQEPPLINITNTLQQQQQQPTSSPPLAPPTTTSNNKSPSIPGTSTFSLHPSPAASSSSGSSSSHKRKSSPEDESATVALKRQRNTLAARKYRQKRLDRISELEAALAAMTSERDDMRLQLARREAEIDTLREMLSKK
ncbi:hypothetical protein NW755_008732 [Fusarium falciforme]|uniref:BZIP domain-containing protein n=1 Tax=Fusarium falciforme TaxID=195108 RepID=A0A9W8R379_9HYPO|nr:hypothetical protein NW755_008732 [Fusarium falciforme]